MDSDPCTSIVCQHEPRLVSAGGEIPPSKGPFGQHGRPLWAQDYGGMSSGSSANGSCGTSSLRCGRRERKQQIESPFDCGLLLRVIRSRQQRCESRAFFLQQPRAGTEHNAPFLWSSLCLDAQKQS
jgi:hypothetical protein